VINALGRIRDISNQMNAASMVLDSRFRQHLGTAIDGSGARLESAIEASQGPAPSSQTAPVSAYGLRPFPRLDRPAPGTQTGTPTTPAGVDLPARAEEWLQPIHDAAQRYGLPPALLTALVWSESAFKPNAVSHAGAIGLAQLMPGTAAMLDVDPYEPLENLDGGARYLAAQLDRFGSVELALAAYNAGPGRVQAAGGIPNIAETRSYVDIVTDRYDRLRGIAT